MTDCAAALSAIEPAPAPAAPAPTALAPAASAGLTARFAADLAALWPESGRLGLAVSGGPDSLALLLLAAGALIGRIEVATVDHRLRPEGTAEAAAVAELCATLGLPHRVLAVTVPPGNIQANARAARYAALADWLDLRGLDALATAHHADDQAETLVMRLNRASGVAGLAGARPRGAVPGSTLPLLRPLLGWRKAELAEIVAGARIIPARDPSNADDRFDRARLRKALARSDWIDPAALATSARHIAEADAALDWAAARERGEAVTLGGGGARYRPGAPRVIGLRVLARIFADLGCGAPRGSQIAALYDDLAGGRPATLSGMIARPGADGWHFRPEPRRR